MLSADVHRVRTGIASLFAGRPPPANADSEGESESPGFGLLSEFPPPADADSEVESESAVFGDLPPADADTLGRLLSEISEFCGDLCKDLELLILLSLLLFPPACCLTLQIRQQMLTLIR